MKKLIALTLIGALAGCATTSQVEELEKSIARIERSIEELNPEYDVPVNRERASSIQSNSVTKNTEIGAYIPAGETVVNYRGDHFVTYRTIGNVELDNPDTWAFEYKTPTMWRWMPTLSDEGNEGDIISYFKKAGLVQED